MTALHEMTCGRVGCGHRESQHVSCAFSCECEGCGCSAFLRHWHSDTEPPECADAIKALDALRRAETQRADAYEQALQIACGEAFDYGTTHEHAADRLLASAKATDSVLEYRSERIRTLEAEVQSMREERDLARKLWAEECRKNYVLEQEKKP